MATKIHFTIEAGSRLDKVIHRVRTTMGANVNLSTYTGVLTLKRNYTSSNGIVFGVSFNANGEVRVLADAANTAAVVPGRYVYDIVAQYTSANTLITTRVVEGYVSVTAGVGEVIIV